MKVMNLLVSVTLLIALSSCEGGTTFTKTIENKSSEEISFKMFTIYGSNNSYVINPNESKEVYWDDQMGAFVDASYSCTLEIDSVQLTISNGRILKKDIMDDENWIRISKDGRNSREDCIFIIVDEDLQ
jgi:hypothetical protein